MKGASISKIILNAIGIHIPTYPPHKKVEFFLPHCPQLKYQLTSPDNFRKFFHGGVVPVIL